MLVPDNLTGVLARENPSNSVISTHAASAWQMAALENVQDCIKVSCHTLGEI